MNKFGFAAVVAFALVAGSRATACEGCGGGHHSRVLIYTNYLAQTCDNGGWSGCYCHSYLGAGGCATCGEGGGSTDIWSNQGWNNCQHRGCGRSFCCGEGVAEAAYGQNVITGDVNAMPAAMPAPETTTVSADAIIGDDSEVSPPAPATQTKTPVAPAPAQDDDQT